MKKKLLVAAVLASLTLSASSVFASPSFSGDGYLQYNNSQGASEIDDRFRLNIDGTIDENLSAHARVVMQNSITNNTTSNAKFDKAYVAAKFSNFDVQVGKDDLFTGKGLLIDDHNFAGIKASTAVEGLKLSGFYGKDGGANKTTTIDASTAYGNVNLGANYVSLGDTHFYGINANTKLGDATLNAEYVKNNTTSAKGYLAGVTMGNYTVSYRDIEDGAVTNYSTNGNYNNSKGFKVSARFDVTKNSSISLYQDFAKDQAGAEKHRTNVEYDINF